VNKSSSAASSSRSARCRRSSRERYGEKDPRVFTLRSILSSLEIADAVLQLVFSSVERALGDSGSLLSKAVRTALKVGLRAPSRKGAVDRVPELALPSGESEDGEEPVG
jgi:hypothetical protein